MRRLLGSGPTLLSVTAVLLLVAPRAEAVDVGVDLHAGTLGAGLGLGFGMSDRWNGRIGFNKFTTDEDFEEEGIDYSTDLELETFYALADFHPFGGGFRVTGGLMANNNELTGDAEVEGGDEVGDTTVPAGFGGRIGADIGFDSAAPYLGIGYGNHVRGWGPVSFSIDLGVLAQGSPQVDLTEEEDIQGVSQQDIEREEQEIEDELEDFDLYPVLSVGLIYRF